MITNSFLFFTSVTTTLSIIFVITSLTVTVTGQTVSTPCAMSMISSFTPCINYITGSSGNGKTPPTTECCNSFRTIMSKSMDCACLVITASVPVQLPINRTLAISLPKACKTGGLPLQCKASGSPLPAPGPVLLGPSPPPPAAAPLSPTASKALAAAPAPESQITMPLAPEPASGPAQEEAPPTKSGIRPVLSPSSSHLSCVSPPSFLLIFIATLIFKCA